MSDETNRPNKGDIVRKRSGDYAFDGIIICEFYKRNGQLRFVVEDDRGICLIMNERQITNG